jgi:OmpA-OmpF porin, OOP family
MRQLLSAFLLVSSLVLAQTPQSDIEQVWLDPSARGSLLVGNGMTLENLKFRAGAALGYTYGNFRAVRDQSPTLLVRDRMAVQVFGAIGLFDFLEIGVNVPVYVLQTGSGTVLPSANGGNAGLGNPWIFLKANILDHNAPVLLGVGVGVGIPVGSGAIQGNGGIEIAPRVQVGKVFDVWQIAAEVGFLYRPTVDYSTLTSNVSDKVGSQVWVGATAATVNAGPRGEFTVRGSVPLLGGGRPGVEAQIGVRWPVGPIELFASAGPGFFGEPNTPAVRAYVGGAFANTPMTMAPCAEGRDYVVTDCPDLDKDKDGIKNGVDKMPLDPEDKDNFQDDDGAPEKDNDNDGIDDDADKCPNKAGIAANQGCPDVDTDNDGLVDRLDKCPNEAEDKDGFEDADGCIDADNDADGIPDTKDSCPMVKGVEQEKGCPVKDSDEDGVADFEDNCPTVKGEASNSGCPAAQKQLVVITKDALKILDKVYFDTGKATIQKRSFPLLDNVASVLGTHTEIAKVRVEGHTDNVGKPEKNKKLSQDRAASVKAYLVKKGVADTRLDPIGFGQEKPSSPNDTKEGKEANRRVEFNIVKE